MSWQDRTVTFRVLASKWRHILIMMEMGTTNKECKIRAELRVFKSIKDSLPTILDCGINPNNNNNIILTTLEQASTNKKNQSNTHHTKRLKANGYNRQHPNVLQRFLYVIFIKCCIDANTCKYYWR